MTDFFITNKGTVHGGAGDDRLTVTNTIMGSDVWLGPLTDEGGGSYSGFFNGLGSNDVIFTGIEHFTFTDLGEGDDSLNTGDGQDILNGGGGNDYLNSGAGIDVIDGGSGTDVWAADKSFATTAISIDLNQTVSSYLGTGSVTNIEALRLTTGSGNDRITGSSSVRARDVIDTGAGDDIITLWSGGDDVVDGGAGDDRLVVTNTIMGADVWLAPLTDDGSGSYSGFVNGLGSNDISFTGIEHFTFTDLGEGDDSLNTGDGQDILNGGGGNDYLNSGGGIDVIDGGNGTDIWAADKSFATTAISIDLNQTTSSYLGSGSVTNIEALRLTTGSGNDRITGSNSVWARDVIDTGAGDDIITLWAGGDDVVDGGAGDDRLVVTSTIRADLWLGPLTDDGGGSYSGFVNGLGSNDISFTGIEHFTFTDLGEGDDSLNTGDGQDVLNGGGGNDYLNSGGGVDVVDGGSGNDIWAADKSFATKGITINLNHTTSTYLGAGEVKNIEGLRLTTGSGNDRITGSNSVSMGDVIDTGAGNDVIRLWGGGSDSVAGGLGHDRLVLTYDIGTSGVWLGPLTQDASGGYSGFFNGLGSNDLNFSGIEDLTFIDKSGGNDSINTGDGQDILNGGGGNDYLNSGGGIDNVTGGLGVDIWEADKSFATTGISINLNKAVSHYLGSGTVKGIEGIRLTTGTGNDKITGHKTADVRDIIATGGGRDVVNLWLNGDDSVNGGAGVDRLNVTVTGSSGGVWLRDLSADAAGGFKGTFNGPGSNDITFAQIESFSFIDRAGGGDIIVTGRGRDLLKGGGGNDVLEGGGGNDRLFGQADNDTLKGGFGADRMFGGAGNDILIGSKGKDVFFGGLDDDVMTGGRHADVFVFNGALDEGLDTITDFKNGVDLIRVSNESFNDLSITSVNGGADTQIAFVSGTVITLEGVSASTIHANDFDIV